MSDNKQRLKKVKYGFDKITSQNSTNWKLILLWIFIFEIIASVIEYLYADEVSKYVVSIPNSLAIELILAFSVTLFVWFCIYNIVFENRKLIIRLIFIGILGLYFILTKDFSLQFLLQNINPLHFFDLEFGLIFFIELFLKILMAYLVYQFIITLRNNNIINNNN